MKILEALNDLWSKMHPDPVGDLEMVEKLLNTALSISDEIIELIQTLASISPWLALFVIYWIKKNGR